MNTTLAVIVSYHPGPEIIGNVQRVLSEASHVIVVDNASSSETKEFLSSLPNERVSFIFNSHNLGVGEGFNQGIRWGLEKSYSHFLLLDQDSYPKEGMLVKLLKVEEEFSTKNKLVLLGPSIEDFDRKIEHNNLQELSPAPLLITSGCLISRRLIDVVGLYDERLFIDHVDHDYCLRVVKMGGTCIKVNSAILLHKFGKAQVKTFLGKTFFLQDYSAFRRYYMTRNRIVLYKRYGMFRGEWFWLDLRSAVVDLIKLVCFESEKLPKLKAVLRGGWHGLCWRN